MAPGSDRKRKRHVVCPYPSEDSSDDSEVEETRPYFHNKLASINI